MADIAMDHLLASLESCDSASQLYSLIDCLSDEILQDIGWEILPGLFHYLDLYPRAKLTWNSIVEKGNASEVCLSLNQILHSDLSSYSAKPLFDSYGQIFERMSTKPSRLTRIKQDLTLNMGSLLHTEWKNNRNVIIELCAFAALHLIDQKEFILELAPYIGSSNETFLKRISETISIHEILCKCRSLALDSIPSGICDVFLHHLQHDPSIAQQDYIDAIGLIFIQLCIVSLRNNRLQILGSLANSVLPILTNWSWKCHNCSEIPILMDRLIPVSSLDSELSRLPYNILNVICSDQFLIELAQCSQQSRPYLSSICLRVLKDRLCSDSRDSSVSSLKSLITDIMNAYGSGNISHFSDVAVELALLDMISCSLNIAIFLALSAQIFVDRHIVRSCANRLCLLRNHLEIHWRHTSDTDRLHSGRMQIRLVESVAERFLQIHSVKKV